MASLTGNKIKDSYLGLLKSIDNIDFVPRGAGVFVQISDGDGNGLPLYLSTAGIRFHNAYTFPSATGTVGQVLSADAAGDLVFSDQLDNQTLEQVLTRGNAATLAILSTADSNTFGSTTFSNTVTLANNSVVSGTPPSASDNSTKIATTAYVDNQVNTGGTVKKTGTIAQNAIAVWNDSVDELRSDPTLNIYEGDNNVPNHSLYLYQPNGATPPVNLYSYNIGGGHLDDVTGIHNTGFGYRNLFEVLGGQQNSAFGYESLRRLTSGSYNSAFGESSLNSLTTGSSNTAFGWQSLAQITTKSGNTAFGTQVLANANGTLVTEAVNNTGLGSGALYDNTTGSNNVAVGHTSLTNVTTGSNNVAIGNTSGFSITTGSNNVTLGGYSNNSSDEGIITLSNGIGTRRISVNNSGKITFHTYGIATHTGTLAKTLGVDTSGNVIEVDAATGNVIISGTPVANQIAIWTNATTIKGDATLLIDANHKITLYQPNSADPIVDTSSYNIGGGNIANVTGINNTGFGLDNLSSLTTGTQNVAIGKSALGDNTEGLSNVSVGYLSLTSNTTGNSNIAIGVQSLQANTYASNNVSIGQSALILNVSGANNTAIGNLSLGANTANSNSTAVGYLSLRNSTGANNTAIGKDSGSAITTGSNNVIIGSNTGSTIATSDNNIIISDGSGNVRQVIDSNGNVGIGDITSPTYRIEANTTSGGNGIKILRGSTSMFEQFQSTTGTVSLAASGTGGTAGSFSFRTGTSVGTTTPKLTISSGGNLTSLAQSTTAPSLTMGADAGQIFKNEDLEFAFGLNNASPYNAWMQTRFTGNGSRNFSINPLGGDVGIGTNSPTAKLHIQGISSSSGGILIKNSGGNPYGIYSDNNDLLFTNGDGTTTALTISYTGLATFQSSVQEKIKLIASSSEYVSLAFANNSGTTQWEISKGNSNELYFYRGGGGSDQGTKLTISSGGDATFSGDIIPKGNTRNISFQGTSVTNINAQIQYDQVNNTTGQLFFKTANSGTLATRLTILSTGRLLIGSNVDANRGILTLGGATGVYYEGNANGKWSTYVGGSGALVFFNWVNSANGSISTSGTFTNSDISLKKHIKTIKYGLLDVLKLKPSSYVWKSNNENGFGFIAQEIEKIIPEIVEDIDIKGKNQKVVNYANITAILTKAIQEQQTVIEDLKSRIETLEG